MSVPALVELAEALADFLGKADALRDPLGDFAMAGKNGNARLQRLANTALDGCGELRERRVREGAGDGANDRLGEFRMVAEIDAGKIPSKRDLVADCRSQQMGVGIASDIAKQRLVIDIAALAVLEAGHVGQPHRQHARPHGKIARLACGEVRRVGQRHQKLSASNRGRRHFALFPLASPSIAHSAGAGYRNSATQYRLSSVSLRIPCRTASSFRDREKSSKNVRPTRRFRKP
jgi:hypothetical protein